MKDMHAAIFGFVWSCSIRMSVEVHSCLEGLRPWASWHWSQNDREVYTHVVRKLLFYTVLSCRYVFSVCNSVHVIVPIVSNFDFFCITFVLRIELSSIGCTFSIVAWHIQLKANCRFPDLVQKQLKAYQCTFIAATCQHVSPVLRRTWKAHAHTSARAAHNATPVCWN